MQRVCEKHVPLRSDYCIPKLFSIAIAREPWRSWLTARLGYGWISISGDECLAPWATRPGDHRYKGWCCHFFFGFGPDRNNRKKRGKLLFLERYKGGDARPAGSLWDWGNHFREEDAGYIEAAEDVAGGRSAAWTCSRSWTRSS